MFKNHKIQFTVCRWLSLALMISTSPALAANNEVKDDIQIQANYMKFDVESGSSIYEGDVKISQGNIKLQGEKIIIQRHKGGIKKIDINGLPAQFTQDEDSENKIHASSQRMLYLASQNRLVMTVDARLEQPGNTIESPRIVYDTKKKTVLAGNNKNKSGKRVNITLTPKKTETSPDSTEKK